MMGSETLSRAKRIHALYVERVGQRVVGAEAHCAEWWAALLDLLADGLNPYDGVGVMEAARYVASSGATRMTQPDEQLLMIVADWLRARRKTECDGGAQA
jgi:hypothetical protein